MCTRCAREISVGDRTGPGLVGWPLIIPLRDRPCLASGHMLWLAAALSRPDSSKMLPCSLPYGGGGARLPVIGAKPHFFTFASIKTNPDCPKLTCTVHGPFAPTAGNKFWDFSPCAISSSFFPFRVKNTVPVRGRYPTPITSPCTNWGPYVVALNGWLYLLWPVDVYATEYLCQPRRDC